MLPEDLRDRRLAWLIGIMAAALVGVTLPQYGITYDEPLYLQQGQRYVTWALDQLAKPAWHWGPFVRELADAWEAAPTWHPPLVSLSSAITGKLFAFLPGLVAFRLLGAVLYGLLAGVMFYFLRVPIGRTGAAFAVAALLTLPRLFAHAHFSALDLPLTVFAFLLAAQFASAAHSDEPGTRYAAGALLGLGLLTKLSAAITGLFLVPWALVFYRNRAVGLTISLVGIGLLVFFLGWPWLWVQPFGNLKAYLGFHIGHFPVAAYYLGETFEKPPWHYALVTTAVTTPLPILGLAVVGIVAALRWHPYRAHRVLLLFGALVPIAVVSLPHFPVYNGERLFLPAFPFIACLAGMGFQWFGDGVRAGLEAHGASERWTRQVLAMLALLLVLPGAYGLLATHPYQLGYYNLAVRRPFGARERELETIYWGQAYLEAVPYLNEQPLHEVFVTPPGAASLLEFYRQMGLLRRGVRVTYASPDASAAQSIARARAADVVLFQAMQSEFDDIAWALYREGRPAWGVSVTGDPITPGAPLTQPAVILAYDAREVRRVLPPP